jgi:hypothetical protein
MNKNYNIPNNIFTDIYLRNKIGIDSLHDVDFERVNYVDVNGIKISSLVDNRYSRIYYLSNKRLYNTNFHNAFIWYKL